jgi:hypothetical protein
MRITQKAVERLSLPAGKRDHIEFDDAVPGFGIRLREGGSRVWVYQYKLGTKQRRMVLGNVKAMSADDARKAAEVLHAKVKLGSDPAGEKIESRARVGETFEAALRPFLAHQKAHLRPRSYVEIERHLLVVAKPLHHLQLTKVDRRAVATLLAQVVTERGASTANPVRSGISVF